MNEVIQFYTHGGVYQGEFTPMGLTWSWSVNAPKTVSWSMHKTHTLADRNILEPYVTDFYLVRDDARFIGGMVTDVDFGESRETLSVSAKSWLHYLERRMFPWDPTNPTLYRFERVNKDVFSIIEDMLDVVLAQANSLSFQYANGLMGTTVNYRIEPGDNEYIFSKISALAEQNPGFDFEDTVDRYFNMYSPSIGSTKTYKFELGKNIMTYRFGDKGLRGNHVHGRGAGTSKKLDKVKEDTTSQTKYRRHDSSVDFPTQIHGNVVDAQTQAELDRAKKSVYEFSLDIASTEVDNVLANVAPGDTVPVYIPDEYMLVDANYKIVNMDGGVNDNGDEILTLHFNDA